MLSVQDSNRLYAELVRQLYRHAPIGIAATLLNSSILTFVLWGVISRAVLLIWLSTIALTTFMRYVFVYRFYQSVPVPYDSGGFYSKLIIGLGLSGFLWGSAGILLFAPNSIPHQVFLAFMLGGMVAGAAGTFSIVMMAFFVYSVPALSPIIIRFFMIGDEIHIVMAGMLSLFWLMMFLTAKRVNATTIAMFKLNASLAEAKERAETANEELKTEIEERNKIELELRRHREHLSEMVEERTVKLTEANARLLAEVEERKRAEEARRKSEERYRTLVETTSDLVWEIDKNTVFTYASPQMRDILGYAPEEVLGKTPFDFMPPEEASRVANVFSLYSESGKPFHLLEGVYNHKDGHRVVLETSGMPIFDEEGEFCGFRGIDRDVTERKKAEEVLRESEEKYRLLVENINDVIYATEENGVITYVSPAIESMSGHRPADVIGRHFRQFIHPEDVQRVTEKFAEIASGKLSPSEYRVLATSGEARWVRGSSRPLIVDGRVVGLQGVLTDITYRKLAEEEKERLEAQLRQAQKMEAIGTLAGGIAHDFNNVLAAIIGYTEIVLSDISEWSPIYDDLKQVLRAAHRAKDMVKQILVFSTMKSEQDRVAVNLGDVIKEAVDFLRPTLPSTIEIRMEIAKEPGIALADPTQIHQVLVNLFTNAAHAMEKGGVLRVTLNNVALGEEADSRPGDLKPGAYMELTVSDTGSGMDSATIERIFDPYFTTKEVGKGSGLGLAVVHGIIKRHEGSIAVHSQAGEGTTFQVFIPRIEQEEEIVREEQTAVPRGTERILLVDDEQMLVGIGQKMLERLGYTVLVETSSHGALETFRRQSDQIDLVITDYTMPHMTGADLAREIMLIRGNVPVILCTGFSERITEGRAKNLGITEFVMKPYNLRLLGEVVRRALDKSKR